MVHFVEITQTPLPYSMFNRIGRVAKLVPRDRLRYLQTTLIMGGRGIGLRIYVRYCRNSRDFFKKYILNKLIRFF